MVRNHAIIGMVITTILCAGCKRNEPTGQTPTGAVQRERRPAPTAGDGASRPDDHASVRARMVAEQLAARGITDERVLAAMAEVPRHELVPPGLAEVAYRDSPLPIGEDQTISQPYIVALMSQLAEITPGEKVLEVGTGSGYQAAVIAAMGAELYSIEIVEALAERARRDLARLGYEVHLRQGDGFRGWPEAAPFDAILVTAAPAKVPEPLLDQLAVGGRMVIPVGTGSQDLRLIRKSEAGIHSETVIPVMFVPMTGEAEDSR